MRAEHAKQLIEAYAGQVAAERIRLNSICSGKMNSREFRNTTEKDHELNYIQGRKDALEQVIIMFLTD